MKLKIPYLTALKRASSPHKLYRWGMAPRFDKAGIKACNLMRDGRPYSADDMTDMGLPGPAPTFKDGRPILRHGSLRAGDRPMRLEDAAIAARILTKRAEAVLAGRTDLTRQVKTRQRTVTDLIDTFFAAARNPNMPPHMKPDTLRSYESWRPLIDLVFGELHPAAIDKEMVQDFYHEAARTNGPRIAYGGVQLLRRCIRWAPKKDWGVLIWQPAGIPYTSRKQRAGTPEEMIALLRAFDDPAGLASELGITDPKQIPPPRPQMGDALVLALWTTMREKDCLELTIDEASGTRIRKTLSKSVRADTSKAPRRINIPIVGPLRDRIADALARRQEAGTNHPQLILCPDRSGRLQPYNPSTFRRHYAEGRRLAAKLEPTLLAGTDRHDREVSAFTFEDCRDTAITRMLRAGLELAEIASYTGHSIATISQILEHYADLDPTFADAGGAKLEAMAKQMGGI